jgi:parallel beta-helix repeat protein
MHVWPRFRLFACTSLFLVGLGALQAAAATYYVDKESRGGSCNNSNPGTITQPVCTIDAGLGKLAAGDTLYVRGGRYDEGMAAGNLPSASSWETATIVASYPGETASLHGLGVSHPTNPPQYVIFKDFDISGGISGVTVTRSMDYPWGTVKARFVNLDIHHWHGPNNGVYVAADGVEYIGGKVHHAPVGPTDCNWESFDCHGFYWIGAHGLIDGVDIYECSGYGIQLYTAYGRTYVNDNIVRNNIIHHNMIPPSLAGGGIVVGSGTNNLIYNNIIYGNRADGIDTGYDAHGTKYYNNTIYGNRDRGLYIDSSIQNAVARNNILYGNTYGLSNDGVGTTLSNNLDGDPLFVNAGAGDFRLQAGSPAINTGFAATFITTDIAGTPRPQPTGGAWDIGAYEYASAATCPPECPPTCPPDCPPDESSTSADMYVSAGGHGDTPSDSHSCRTAETITTPKATLASACTCMTIPGKAMVLRGGTYAAALNTSTCPITGGTSWDAPTRLKRYANETPVLQLPASAPDAVMTFASPSTDGFIEVDGLTLDGASRANGDGLLVLYSRNLHFKNLHVHHNHTQNIALLGASHVEIVTSTLTDALGGANVSLQDTSTNIVIRGNTITQSPVAGVSLDASAVSNGVVIAKNTMTNTGTGIDIGPGTGALVENNVIQRQSNAGVRVRSGAAQWKVYHNDSVSNTGTGLVCESGATGGDFANNIAVANTAAQLVNTCGALTRGNILTGTLAELFTTVPVLKETPPLSPAINSGVDLPSVTDDQIGTARPFAVKWDAGAREAQVAPGPGPRTGVRIGVMMFF